MDATPAFPLKPRTLAELLDLIFKVYRRGFLRFARVGVPVSLTMWGAAIIWQLLIVGMVDEDPADPAAAMALLGATLLGVPILMLVFLLAQSAGQLLVGLISDDIYHGRPTGWTEVLARARARYLHLVLANLLFFLILAAVGVVVLIPVVVIAGVAGGASPGLAVLFIFAGFFFALASFIPAAVACALRGPAVFLEGRNGARAIGRSFELIFRRGPRGLSAETNWVRVLLVGFMLIVLSYILAAVTQGPAAFVDFANQWQNPQAVPTVTPLQFVLGLVGAVLTGFVYALSPLTWPLVYYDIRVRHEGLDIERAVSAESGGA